MKPAASRTDAAAAAETLARRLLTAIQQPYVFNGQQVHLSASIGIALYPDVRHANDTAAHDTHLLRWADHALLQAKAAGGNTLAFYVPDDNPADAERLKLEADLYDGVRNGEFSLHFQPITSSRTHGVVGVEALIRWTHPVHGLRAAVDVHSARRVDRPDQLPRQLGAEGRLHAVDPVGRARHRAAIRGGERVAAAVPRSALQRFGTGRRSS